MSWKRLHSIRLFMLVCVRRRSVEIFENSTNTDKRKVERFRLRQTVTTAVYLWVSGSIIQWIVRFFFFFSFPLDFSCCCHLWIVKLLRQIKNLQILISWHKCNLNIYFVQSVFLLLFCNKLILLCYCKKWCFILCGKLLC